MERKETPMTMALRSAPDEIEEKKYTTTSQTGPKENSVYDLPSVEALVRYMHAVSGFPVKSTCIKAIKHGNCYAWI